MSTALSTTLSVFVSFFVSFVCLFVFFSLHFFGCCWLLLFERKQNHYFHNYMHENKHVIGKCLPQLCWETSVAWLSWARERIKRMHWKEKIQVDMRVRSSTTFTQSWSVPARSVVLSQKDDLVSASTCLMNELHVQYSLPSNWRHLKSTLMYYFLFVVVVTAFVQTVVCTHSHPLSCAVPWIGNMRSHPAYSQVQGLVSRQTLRNNLWWDFSRCCSSKYGNCSWAL